MTSDRKCGLAPEPKIQDNENESRGRKFPWENVMPSESGATFNHEGKATCMN